MKSRLTGKGMVSFNKIRNELKIMWDEGYSATAMYEKHKDDLQVKYVRFQTILKHEFSEDQGKEKTKEPASVETEQRRNKTFVHNPTVTKQDLKDIF